MTAWQDACMDVSILRDSGLYTSKGLMLREYSQEPYLEYTKADKADEGLLVLLKHILHCAAI